MCINAVCTIVSLPCNNHECIVWCVVRHAWCVVRCAWCVVWCVHGVLWGTGVRDDGVLCTVGTHKMTASLRSEHALLLQIQHKAIRYTGSTENGISF